ncbi:MAG: alpha/beta fold hydrolase [Candidatus Margulisbacteria bacterium]|jgi:flagellar hook assembly protein FlgD/pimeloyl-ACP methyl ester carboxylesterase|nr:alpha/beta fold hydrolase [Candidatus Margulisiibacteriota bacterium]
MKKIFFLPLLLLLLCGLSAGLAAEIQPVNLRALPEHMRSYKNYLVVFVHGMGSDAEAWTELKKRLPDLVGDPDFAGHLYAYTLSDPNAAYYGNAAELKDWLSAARREFIAAHPDWPPDKIPAKFILLTHSMGALTARSYIYSDTLAAARVDAKNFPRGFYQDDVQKAVFLAPPHRGSSMADFIYHYMLSDQGYYIGSAGVLRQAWDIYDRLAQALEALEKLKEFDMSKLKFEFDEDGVKLGQSFDLPSELQKLNDEFCRLFEEYEFSLRLADDGKYQASLRDLQNKIAQLTELYDSFSRLGSIFGELDSAPLLTFPLLKTLVEANNYLASILVKDLLDTLLTQYFLKEQIEGGAVRSLLSRSPVTTVLNLASLPPNYDPVLYRNIIPRGLVAFDRRNTEVFNQSFYGNLPALLGAAEELTNFTPGSFISGLAANSYQVKLLSSPEYQRLPSGEARLLALLMSYARGLFTVEGDGAVDIDSLRGRDIPNLSAAKNYYKDFAHDDLADYFDHGFLENTVEAEAACVVVELALNAFGWTTPPGVRGAIRAMPLFDFVSVVVQRQEALAQDFLAHNNILLPQNSLPQIEQSLYEAPLLVLQNIYTVSGDEQIELGADALQEQTAADQTNTTLPLRRGAKTFYLPLAYNVKAPQVRLSAELYDLAPHLAKLEYSFNFAPYTTAPVDKWGAVTLPDFSVAEGQNIIAFRAVNRLGQTTEQFLRIIRSSTPLLASEIFPEPFAAVNTGNLTLSLVLYNAQFITDNLGVSSIDELIVDGEKLSPGQYALSRGANQTYRNYLKLTAPLTLGEGRHTLSLQAHDAYGHHNSTNWFFTVDALPPEINIEELWPVSIGQLLTVNYFISDNFTVLSDLQINLRTDEEVLSSRNYALAGAGPQQELFAVGDWPDGEYILEIGVADQAGNRAVRQTAVIIDSQPPRVSWQKNANTSKFILTASEKISGQVILAREQLRVPLPLDFVTENIYAADFSGLPDGVYAARALVSDLAGNTVSLILDDLCLDTRGPQIVSLRAEPVILNGDNSYRTKIICAAPDAVRADVLVKHKSSGQEIIKAPLETRDGVFIIEWSAAPYPRGAYIALVTVTDRSGRQTARECEIIKDGITPEIILPAAGGQAGGVVSVTGKAVDPDWNNALDFDFYALYWAAGWQPLPENLRAVDTAVWQTTGLETPQLDRAPDTPWNISCRQSPENGLLAWWDTRALPAGQYTLLLLAAEKNPGLAVGAVCQVLIEPPPENRADFRVNLEQTASQNTKFTLVNLGSTANISAEIIDKYGHVVQQHFWPDVPAAVYLGQPEISAAGVYLWQAADWHLRLAATENSSFQLLLAGIGEVLAADIPYTLNSGLLQIEGQSGGEIVFALRPQTDSLFINTQDSAPLYIGASRYQPPANVYWLSAKQSAGALDLTWDGRLTSGGYSDSGEYYFQLSCYNTDGGGFKRAVITFNIETPFAAQSGGLTPVDGSFDAFGELHKITLAYKVNKDSYLRAAVLDETGVTISVLPEEKILGSTQLKYLSWNGAYPDFAGRQRLVSGNYRILLTLRACDGSAEQILSYDNIKIQNNISGDLARLEPLGEALLFNGQTVQAVSGSSQYYWSARGEGVYTVPQTFSYELELSGEQAVTAAPFVPFAGLYHRGFNRVDLVVEVSYEWSVDYKNGSGAGWKTMQEGWESDDFSVALTLQNQTVSNISARSDHGSGWKITNLDYGYVNPGADHISVTLKDTAGNVLCSGGSNGGIFESANFCNGAFDIKVSTVAGYDKKSGKCYIYSKIDRLRLKDDIKYSRLTNRYYAWYGYVNKYYPQEMDFSAMWNDLGKLGFVPSSYFLNGLTASTLNALFAETYPQVISGTAAQNQSLIEALQKINILYESMPCTDNSYYQYLADEYCEFIPMTSGQTYFTPEKLPSSDLTAKAAVYTDFVVTANILWPASEEYIVGEENKAKRLIDDLAARREIELVDYPALPRIFDKQSINFGGLGFSRLPVQAALGKNGLYQKSLLDITARLPKTVNRNSLQVKIINNSPAAEVWLDGGNVLARYSSARPEQTLAWSTEQDFFLRHGVIDSAALRFNAQSYAPQSEPLYLYEAYFDPLNRRADLPAQNITPVDYYTFLAQDYYNADSGYVLNPNLDFTRWTVQVYDQTGQPNQDFTVTEVNLSNENIWQNNFRLQLNLDAAEKRYVEICGQAADAYELLYFDGETWRTICTGNAASGRLGWWDVTQLNGAYTLALKAATDDDAYSLATQEIFLGQLLRRGESDAARRKISSPYKRAEVFFHPQSFAEDKFITVAPVKLQELDLKNRPDIYALGPVMEILPHGSSFPEPDKRPTVVFRYSQADLAELRARGVDLDKLGLYYINADGELESANSQITQTEYGVEILTVLQHFSPYTVLAGEVPPLPTFNAAWSDLRGRRLKIFGRARPQSALEIYLDDDEFFGDSDGADIVDSITATTDAAAWIFDRRAWNADYLDKLDPEQKDKALAARRLLQEMYWAALADNQAAEQEYARQYAELITADQTRAELIREFLLANNRADLLTASSGVALQEEIGLRLALTAPTLNNVLPERLEVILRQSFPLLLGQPAAIFKTTADDSGYFVCELPLENPTASIFVTYALTGNIQNRPVARLDFVADPEAPQFLAVALSSAYANRENPALSVTLNLSEAAKLLISAYNARGELLDLQYENTYLPEHTLQFAPPAEGVFYYTVQAFDPAGNAGPPLGFTVTADFSPPLRTDIQAPQYINPQKNNLLELIHFAESIATYSIALTENINYEYFISAADAAGNVVTLSGVVYADTEPPLLTDFSFGPQAQRGVRIYWPETETANYLLTARSLNSSSGQTYNIAGNYYYDQLVSPDTFYEYTLQAVDAAGNTSNILSRLIYTADDSAQVLSDGRALIYQDIQIQEIPARPDSLFVARKLSVDRSQTTKVQLTPVYRFLASGQERLLEPLTVTLSFAPESLAEKYIRPETLFVEGGELLTVNYQTGAAVFRALDFGDYALFGLPEYRLFDHTAPLLRFLNIKNGDYLDPAATLSVEVREQDSAVDTQNMYLLLDNKRYVLPPENLRGERLEIKLSALSYLPDGGHILDLFVGDLAGNTANAALRFSAAQEFQITKILPAPNPFDENGVYFTYQLSRPAGRIEIRIYDTNGRLVRELNNCSNQAGFNSTRWDGCDRRGAFVANDVYLYVLKIEQDGRERIIKGKVAALR